MGTLQLCITLTILISLTCTDSCKCNKSGVDTLCGSRGTAVFLAFIQACLYCSLRIHANLLC